MPDFGMLDDTDYSTGLTNTMDFGGATAAMSQSAAVEMQPRGWSTMATLGGSAALAVPDLIDTVNASIPGLSSLTGLKRGDITRATADVIDMAGLSDFSRFYADNKGAVEVGSAVAGIIGAEIATGGLITFAAPMLAGMRGFTAARKIMSLDGDYAAALKNVAAIDMQLGQRGMLSASQYTEAAKIFSFKGDVLGQVSLADDAVSMTRTAAAGQARMFGARKVAARTAATEGMMIATLNQNSFLYVEDESTNIMFASLGIAGGAVGGRLGANYAMRKFVNSDQMQRVYAGALDVTGLERSLLESESVAKGALDKTYKGTYLGSLQGSVTDRVTALGTAAKAAPKEGVDPTNANRLAIQQTQLMHEEAQKATIKGIRGAYGTGFSMDAEGYGNAIRQALHDDPGALLLAEMVGGAGPGLPMGKIHREFVDGIAKRKQTIQDMMADNAAWHTIKPEQRVAYQKEIQHIKFMETLTPVPIIDGEATTMSHAQVYDDWFEPDIQTKSEGGLSTWESINPQDKKPHGIGLDSDMSLYLPEYAKGDINQLDHFDSLRLYRSAQQSMKSILGDPKAVLKLPAEPNWFQLDMAEEVLRRSNQSGKVQFPGIMTRETAQVEAFAQKVDAIGGMHLTSDPTQIMQLRVQFNLPKLSAYESGLLGTEEHPIDILVRGAIAAGGSDTVRKMNLSELMDGIQMSKRLSDIAQEQKNTASGLMGNTFNFLRDSQGNVMKPILTYKRPFMPTEFVKDNLAERIAVAKMHTLGTLSGDGADPLTRALTINALQSPDYELASRASSLADIQMSAATPGIENLAPGSAVRSFTDGLTTTEHKMRDNPIVLAMTRMRETIERQVQGTMRQTFETAFEGRLSTLNGPRSTESKALLEEYFSHAGGWQVSKTPVQTAAPDGRQINQFVLEDNMANRDRFLQQFGREMKKGELLPSPNGKALALDELGMEMLTRFNVLSDTRIGQRNTIRKALGLAEMRTATFYVPPPNVEGKIVGHTFDALNRIVPGGTVVANTQEQFSRLVNRLSDKTVHPNSPLTREGHVFRTQTEIQEFATAMDRAQQEMVNPGRTFVPTASNRGGIAGQEYNPAAFEEALTTMRDGFLQHGRDLMEVLYKDQINVAKSRAAISNAAMPGNQSATQKQKSRSIFDFYVQEATGQSPLNSEKSWWGRTLNEIEGKADRQLAETGPKVFAAVREYFGKANPYAMTPRDSVAFDKMVTALGPHMPFKSAQERLMSELNRSEVTKLADITGAVSRFEATWILRMLEPVQAGMNLGGMLNAAPAVMRHLAQKPMETTAEYAARVGHSAQIFTSADGLKSMGMLDMGKMMLRGFKRNWNADPAELAYIAQNGFGIQEVAEFQTAFNAAKNRSQMDLFLNGDPTSKSKFAQKGLVGWMSVLTDKSEGFSRLWGHMMGLELAESLGIEAKVAKHNFAHDMANKMIANYSPQNRPEMFQGAIGAPIGLFQSFIYAYYQRLFRYVETGDTGALGAQYATQAGLFGLKTVPGFQEMNSLFFTENNGDKDLMDHISERFGQSTSDLLMAGTLGNIPAMFGGESMDLTSRGDTSFRTPVFNAPAIWTTGVKIGNGLADMAGLFSSKNPDLSATQVAEVFANAIPNRPMAGMIEQIFGEARDTDGKGALISESQSWMESAYRMMGTRSYRESRDIEAYYTHKQGMEIQANKMATLRETTRGVIRDRGVTEESLSEMNDVFATYIQQGGDPKQYKKWIKSQFKAATETRTERELERLLKNDRNQSDANRLLNNYVPDSSEDAVDMSWDQEAPDPMNSPTPTNSELDDTNMMYGLDNGMTAQ